jgi:hypothetical protein
MNVPVAVLALAMMVGVVAYPLDSACPLPIAMVFSPTFCSSKELLCDHTYFVN